MLGHILGILFTIGIVGMLCEGIKEFFPPRSRRGSNHSAE